MNNAESLNTSDTSDDSSIFSSNCFEDISSIQSLSFNTSSQFPSNPFTKIRYAQDSSSSSNLDSLYHENEMLKRKIQNLEKSLKSQGIPNTFYEDAFQYKSWIRSSTQYFTDSHNDSCIKSLSEEFGTAWEAGPLKRGRTFGSEKEPQKFLKLAMMKSIGTLKF
jgi:hypothetical protein